MFPHRHHLSVPTFLRRGRVHEVYGAGAIGFALSQVTIEKGNVAWLHLSWDRHSLCPSAIGKQTSRVFVVRTDTEHDLMWATEEALRSGAVGAVIAQPQAPLSLTAGRRLQLAAEAGRATGLMLIKEGNGSPAAETRWYCRPIWHAQDSTRSEWTLKKNKSGTLGDWIVSFDAAQGALRVASSSGERPGTAPQAMSRALCADPAHGQCRKTSLSE